MWTATLDLDPKRVLLTRLLGRFYPGAYVASFSPLQVQNLPRQTLPANNWVRVRNRLAGISGNDLLLIRGDGDFRVAPAALTSRRPAYPGDEVVGEVIEIGDDVQHLHVGDRVVFQYASNCVSAGAQPLCRSCAAGNYTLCENGELLGPQPFGGGWSEEMLLHEQQLFPISSQISDEQAVMISPTAVALHAVLRRPPQANERVLIVGAGTIGLLTLQLVHLLAPQAEVSILARHSFQVEQATRMGAAHIIYPQDSYSGVQQATHAHLYRGLFNNRLLLGGYDAIYDTVSSPQTLHNALRWIRTRGTIVQAATNLSFMHLDLTPVWYQEVNLLGSRGHGLDVWPLDGNTERSTFSIVAELIEGGRLHPEQLITHHFALNDYKHALLTTMSKTRSRAIKVVFDHALLPVSVVPNVRASAHQPRPGIIDTEARRKARESEAIELPVPTSPLSPSSTPPSTPEPSSVPLPAPLPVSYDNSSFDEEPDENWDQDTEAALPVVRPWQVTRPIPASELENADSGDRQEAASKQDTRPIPAAEVYRGDEPPATSTIPAPASPSQEEPDPVISEWRTPEPADLSAQATQNQEAREEVIPYEADSTFFVPSPASPYPTADEQKTDAVPPYYENGVWFDVYAETPAPANLPDNHEADAPLATRARSEAVAPEATIVDPEAETSINTLAASETEDAGRAAQAAAQEETPLSTFEMPPASATSSATLQSLVEADEPANTVVPDQSAKEAEVPQDMDQTVAPSTTTDEKETTQPVLEAVYPRSDEEPSGETSEGSETLQSVEDATVTQVVSKKPRTPRRRKKSAGTPPANNGE